MASALAHAGEPPSLGLGLRRDLYQFILDLKGELDFVELAPENWMGIGGYWKRVLNRVADRYPIICHGLSLSVGSPEGIDWQHVRQVKQFLKDYQITLFSEHLSFTRCDNAHLYELLPIPFRSDAVRIVAERIKAVQSELGMRIAIENVSYYTALSPEMNEVQFIAAILEEADCYLLLDINNVYVNGYNHGYDPEEFLESLPLHRVAAIHVAGHEHRYPDLIIDTHGSAIVDPVYRLLERSIKQVGAVPVLIERDFNFPEETEFLQEIAKVRASILSPSNSKEVAQ